MTRQQRSALAQAGAEKAAAVNPDVEHVRVRAELAHRLTLLLATILALVLSAVLMYLAASAQAAAAAVKDCTEPGGVCHARVLAEEDAAIQRIVAESTTTPNANSQNVALILGILDHEYPAAAKVVRAELGATP